MKNFMKAIALTVVLAVTATSAFAGTTATNTTTLATTLNLTATLQSALKMTISAGTATIGGTLASHCAIGVGTPDFTMDLGNIDALAINAGTCGGKIQPVTPGTSNAVYYADYNITPIYTSQAAFAGTTLTEKLTTAFSSTSLTAVTRGNSAVVPVAVSDFTPLTAGGTPLATAGVASGTALTRFVGVSVSPANGAGLTGPGTAVITYTLTVL